MSQITLQDIKNNHTINAMIHQANQYLEAIGYTDHGPRHVGYVSKITAEILEKLHYDKRTVELGAIAGWVHDVGNFVNRQDHGISGGILLFPVLQEAGMDVEEVLQICTAVGNHEELAGKPVSEISAALIIADKIDAHRSRVRSGKYDFYDQHDRVNYAIRKTQVTADPEEKVIRYSFIMDESSSIKEFLQIYMTRMTMTEECAAFLGCRFELVVNGVLVNNLPKMPDLANGVPKAEQGKKA